MHWVVLVATLLLGANYFASAWEASQGQNCTAARSGGYDNTCPTDAPFCQYITGTIWQCRECRTDCDCSVNSYCSNESPLVGEIGFCRKFYKAGAECFPMSAALLTDSTIDDKLKCAIIVPDDQGDLEVEYDGYCIQGRCRMCDATNTGVTCYGEYMGGPRTCVFPGYFGTIHSQNWEPGKYYEEPVRVWLAICFVLILISLGVGAFTLYLVWNMWNRKENADFAAGKPPSALASVLYWIEFQCERLFSKLPFVRRKKAYTRFDQYTSFDNEDTSLLSATRTSQNSI